MIEVMLETRFGCPCAGLRCFDLYVDSCGIAALGEDKLAQLLDRRRKLLRCVQ